MRTGLAGFSALEDQLSLKPVQPLTTTSIISTSRFTSHKDGFRVEHYPASYKPLNTIRGNFEFGLKYEDLNFEWLSRFFSVVPSDWILDWLKEFPNSLYARRTAFFCEWFTGKQLDCEGTTATAYEDAIDPNLYLTRTSNRCVRNKRWKISDNLPGTVDFCPLVRLTEDLISATNFDLTDELDQLDNKFGADLLLRSAAWLTFNESKASFLIEREQDRKDQIKRFASAMQLYCGKLEDPLSEVGLETFQNEILGPRRLITGIRKSPVFVGGSAHHDVTIVNYIAPPFTELDRLMNGLRYFTEITTSDEDKNRIGLIRASAISFAFVYLHPMADGNGRIHRLLVNDTLMRDGLIPPGIILPVSSTIIKSSTRRGLYESTLNKPSSSQMRKYNIDYKFDEMVLYEDGIESNFVFSKNDDAMHFWKFLDLTAHCTYMSQIIHDTVTQNMTEEALFLSLFDEALRRLKNVYEMPDMDAGYIIRSLRENKGRVSNTIKGRYPTLFGDEAEEGLTEEIIEAVMSALQQREQEFPPQRQPKERDH
jgi:hypothetical protein